MTPKTMGERAWYAYHCLPRGKNGKPPPRRPFEEAHGLHNGTLKRVFLGASPRAEMLDKVALALEVPIEWLLRGEGKAPKLSGVLPPISSLEREEDDGGLPIDQLVAKIQKGKHRTLAAVVEERRAAGPISEPALRALWAVGQQSPIDFDRTTWHFILKDLERSL